MSSKGNHYALAFQDYLTKWLEVLAVPDRTATTIAHYLTEVIWRHGVPHKIIHDRAAEFLSDVLQDTTSIIVFNSFQHQAAIPKQTDWSKG